MRRPQTLLYPPLLALALTLALTACGSAVSTTSFKGEQHQIAQTIANFQNAATTGEYKKICNEMLSTTIVTRLGNAKGCEKAIKNQLNEIDNLQVTVQSVHVAAGNMDAKADLGSIYEGKKRLGKLSLVKQHKHWKISGP